MAATTTPFQAARALGDAVPYVRAAWPAHVDLWLDGNEGGLPEPALCEAFEARQPRALGRYPDARGLERVLAASWGVSPERVIVTAGADDALLRLCMVALAPGREVLLPTPTFEMLERYATLAGGTIRPVPWEEGPYPLDAVLSAATPRTALAAVVSPNNPTGLTARASDLARLADALRGALVLLDHAYVEFAEEDLTPVALALPNVVVVRTFSKAFGLAGLRVGYAIGSEAIVRAMRAAGHPFPVSGPSLSWAQAALGSPPSSYVPRVRSERRRLESALNRLDARVTRSDANFVFARLNRASWARDALAAQGIAVRDFPRRAGLEDALRIACPGQDAALERVERALATALAPEALLFDMDGVLADIRGSYVEAVRATAARYGVALTEADVRCAQREPGSNDDWSLTQRLLAQRGVTVPLDEVTEAFERIYQGADGRVGLRRFESALVPAVALEGLARRLPLAVVTGRPRRDAERFLAEHGLARYFQAVISREDAPLKPSPEPVRRALERLGVTRAWMLGDTPDDVRAARAAGVVPIGVCPADDPGGVEALEAAGAARVLAEAAQVQELLS